MDNVKALVLLTKELIPSIRHNHGISDHDKALNLAISALTYRVPKKIDIRNGKYFCGSCGELFGEVDVVDNSTPFKNRCIYCMTCGQRLKWRNL